MDPFFDSLFTLGPWHRELKEIPFNMFSVLDEQDINRYQLDDIDDTFEGWMDLFFLLKQDQKWEIPKECLETLFKWIGPQHIPIKEPSAIWYNKSSSLLESVRVLNVENI